MAGHTVFFGELLLRLSAPGRELLMQSPRLDLNVGGAEANVAVGLASLGHSTSMVSLVPDNALGRAAISAMRGHGIDCTGIQTRAGRMGLYFLASGAGLRASEIIYDRLGSSFANADADTFEWDELLKGAGRLHLSGITPALGPISAKAAIVAAKAAQARNIPISFDGNYRAMLWDRWDGNPRAILSELIDCADVLFGSHRDISLVLGRTFSGGDAGGRRAAAEAAFMAFPRLQLIASTHRQIENADCHRIAARVDARDQFAETDEIAVSGIVDRIGAGDAFAAGVLHAQLSGADVHTMAQNGLALTCLKHSLPGDASLFRQADIDAFNAGEMDVRR